jgi:hypothetical protein
VIGLVLLGLNFSVVAQKHFSSNALKPGSAIDLEEKFNLLEIDRFDAKEKPNHLFLENGYASSILKNPDAWHKLPKAKSVVEINLIYTKYPLDKSLWRTNYKKLLTDRLNQLFLLDSSLNSEDIEWNLVLQTQCKSEQEAILLPHGIEIVYEARLEEPSTDSVQPANQGLLEVSESLEAKVLQSNQNQLKRFLAQLSPSPDSTIERVFDRHLEWKNSLVVMDWTGSMYEFGVKLILWHTKHLTESGVKNLVLFTDQRGDDNSKSIGACGGVFYQENTDVKKLMKLMKSLKNKESNDIEENNIDALLKGVEKSKDFSELIMIADNRSCMKDYCKADSIKVPVKIILCGSQLGINPQYVNLAYKTGGSIHTLESDTKDIGEWAKAGKSLVIDGFKFKFNTKKDRFEVDYLHSKNAFQDCTKFYKKKCGPCEN